MPPAEPAMGGAMEESGGVVVDLSTRARHGPGRSPDRVVVPEDLDARYRAEARGRVVRVLAPAGYGKTSVVVEWIATDDRVVGWLDVTEAHDDPGELGRGMSEALADALDPSDHGDLVERVGSATTPFVLVLDDVHRLRTTAALGLLDVVAHALPPHSTIVLCGRGHRAGRAMAALSVAPGVVEVGVDDLALSPAEATELLSDLGVELVDVEVARLVEVFEGWPAGVRLAGALLRDDPAQRRDLDGLGRCRDVVDYLLHEWLGGLDAADRRRLQEISCLDRVCGPMGVEVLGLPVDADHLRRLHRDEAVLVPLDRRDEWFRVHPLLAACLAGELEATDPDRATAIHRGASDWWEERGDVDRAVGHAERAGDVDRCIELIERHGPHHLTRGWHVAVGRWLGRLPSGRRRASPSLCALAALDALHDGDGDAALQWSRLVSRAAPTGSGEAAPGPVAPPGPTAHHVVVLTATLEPRATGPALASLERAAASIEDGPWRSFGRWVVGGHRALEGDLGGAREHLGAAIFEAELAQLPVLHANTSATDAVLADLVDQPADAGRLASRAVARRHQAAADAIPTTAIVDAAAALVAARRADRDAALAALVAARAKLACFTTVAPWYNVLARVPMVRATLLLGEVRAGRELYRELEVHLARHPASGTTATRIGVLGEMVDVALGDLAAPLTAAELRVLRYLPTNLSLSDIGERLFVSRNTVKTHAASIYRKLDSTSRREAVEAARHCGVLDAVDADGLG